MIVDYGLHQRSQRIKVMSLFDEKDMRGLEQLEFEFCQSDDGSS